MDNYIMPMLLNENEIVLMTSNYFNSLEEKPPFAMFNKQTKKIEQVGVSEFNMIQETPEGIEFVTNYGRYVQFDISQKEHRKAAITQGIKYELCIVADDGSKEEFTVRYTESE